MTQNRNELNRSQGELPGADAVRERLREIRMGEHQRLVAEAHLARAEAVADLIARAAASVRGAVRALLKRPWRRIAQAQH